MGLFDVLRGQREPSRPNLESLFALTTVELTMRANLGFEVVPRAAVCFKPVQAGAFDAAMRELDELLSISERSSGAEVSHVTDGHGFHWVVVADADLGDMVVTVHAASQTMVERGFGDQLLAAVFGFRREGQTVWLVYAYKRGTFYPFVPVGERDRDRAVELRLKATLERELPLEQELERWYPLWGLPLAAETPGP